MGAKIMLTGQAQDIRKLERSVSFCIVTGPTTKHPPRGLKLFGPTLYRVECTTRQWRRARCRPDDRSDLIVEGYLAPRRDHETGRLYIAVVAMSLCSALSQCQHKLDQLRKVLDEAQQAFQHARQAGAPQQVLEERAAAFVKAHESVQKLLNEHPELISGER